MHIKRIYWLTGFVGLFLFVSVAVFLAKEMINESLTESMGPIHSPMMTRVSEIYNKHDYKTDISSKKLFQQIGQAGKSTGSDWITIYSPDGSRLFSNGKGNASVHKNESNAFLKALEGKISGNLSSYPFPFALFGKKQKTNYFSLYMPIRNLRNNSVAGVLETGIDVTSLMSNLSKRGGQVLAFFIVFFLLFQLLFFFIMKRSDRTHEKIHLQSRKFGFNFFKYYDGLTRLPNRLMFMENLAKVISAEREEDKLLGVMYIGIDRLKTINDGLGHEAGNFVILEIVKRLRDCTRGRDVLSRMSGDEFAIVCEGKLTNHNMEMLAERIMKNVRNAVSYEDRELVVTASVGFALDENGINNPERLVENANIAMRNAKRLGGNRFEFYTETEESQSSERLELEIGLWNAMERKEFLIYYQPKVHTFTGEVIGMEALLRWLHPGKGIISPSRFIPLLEETGLMVPVGDWMIYEACCQTKKWHDEGHDNLRVSVNLSMCQFISDNLVDNVSRALKESGLPPQFLEIELTESLLAEDVERAVASAYELKKLGVKLSLDDFGTGYSSLSHITRFPIDTLKVDRAFIKDVTDKKEHATLTTAIVALAKSLHLEIVAEGVETLDHFNFVKDLGCDEIQGFFFSAPVPTEGFKSTLKNIERQVLAFV